MRESEGKQAPELFAKAFNYFNIGAATVFLFVALFLQWIVAIPIPFLNYPHQSSLLVGSWNSPLVVNGLLVSGLVCEFFSRCVY